jgi:hypothetical protein
MMATIPPGVLTSNLCDSSCELPALLMLGEEQQLAAVQLSHYVYKLLSIISQQMTSVHRLVLFYTPRKYNHPLTVPWVGMIIW